MKISEMTVGTKFTGFYILKSAALKTTTTGKPFLSAVIFDNSGTIEAKMWDYTGPLSSEDEGKVIKIMGMVSEFKGSLQVTVERLRLAAEDDPFSLADLVPTAPIDTSDAMLGVENMLQRIPDDDYRKISLAVLEKYREKFMSMPAAKAVHHAFLGGLLMHTYNMMRTAQFMTQLYGEIINESLLIAGTFLHDFAKIHEFSTSEIGLVTDYSVKGCLLGHLVMGAMELQELGKNLSIPEEKLTLLQHMILSHHGEPEFGAAVECQCAESELLSYIDRIDSRMEIYAETFEKTPAGTFSEKVFALDGKRLYNHATGEKL